MRHPTSPRHRRLLAALFPLLLAAGAALPLCATAQEYPVRPITLLVGYAPGGPVDAAARIMVPALEKRLGQPVVIDNRGGASGTIAAGAIAKAAPDGYTLFFAASATQTISPHVQKRLPYDSLKDYTPIALLVNAPNVLIVNKDKAIPSLSALVALAKAQPGKVSFGSAGPGASNHLAGELLRKLTGTEMLHVAYKGNAPAMTDVMGGQITFMFDAVSTGAAAVGGKRVAALAVTSAQRHPLLPDVPTMAEAGIPNFPEGSFYALEGPPGLPAPVVARLNAAVRAVLADPAVARRLVDAGYEITPSSPDELATRVRSEYERWGQVAQGLVFE
jgi:tripartite-type tricarboxylate transporter receptor subunit TctC